MKTRFLIIGAGPTGLGAAYRLKESHQKEFLILESSNHPGGLAASYQDEKGFIWDMGGHVHFSHYPYYDKALDQVTGPDAWFVHQRNSQIWNGGRLIPYPFQNNIHRLSRYDQMRCLAGLLSVRILKLNSKQKNFKMWLENNFGPGICDIFMVPYNQKVWAYPLEMIDTQWMGERVANVDFYEVLKNTLLNRNNSVWGPNNAFRFPKKGGTGFIWEKMAEYIGDIHIRYDSRLKSVDPMKKIAVTDHDEISYDHLISTIPIPVLADIIEENDLTVREFARRLMYSKTHVVGLGLAGHPPDNIQKIGWMYFPQPNVPFYRATLLSNYSPYCVPDPNSSWSLLMEISESPYRNKNITDPTESCVEAALSLSFIKKKNEVISRWYKKAEFGYPTPHLERDEILQQIHSRWEPLSIYSRGRFGGWKYEVSNQDHSFMQGVEIIDRLLSGRRESIYLS